MRRRSWWSTAAPSRRPSSASIPASRRLLPHRNAHAPLACFLLQGQGRASAALTPQAPERAGQGAAGGRSEPRPPRHLPLPQARDRPRPGALRAFQRRAGPACPASAHAAPFLVQTFSPAGTVERIVLFEKPIGLQALIQMASLEQALAAKTQLNRRVSLRRPPHHRAHPSLSPHSLTLPSAAWPRRRRAGDPVQHAALRQGGREHAPLLVRRVRCAAPQPSLARRAGGRHGACGPAQCGRTRHGRCTRGPRPRRRPVRARRLPGWHVRGDCGHVCPSLRHAATTATATGTAATSATAAAP